MKQTLLIMAAGIGSRFGGGIKQLEPVGLHDEIIMDYSIHDAIEAGFILKNTLSDNGGVTRGICKVAEGHTHLSDVVETGNIVKKVDERGNIGAEADGVGKRFKRLPFISLNSGDIETYENCSSRNRICGLIDSYIIVAAS